MTGAGAARIERPNAILTGCENPVREPCPLHEPLVQVADDWRVENRRAQSVENTLGEEKLPCLAAEERGKAVSGCRPRDRQRPNAD